MKFLIEFKGMHFCFCCPISLDSSLAQWSKLFLNSDPNSFRQVGLIICVIGTRATMAHFSRQDRYSSGHITSMPPLPPCSCWSYLSWQLWVLVKIYLYFTNSTKYFRSQTTCRHWKFRILHYQNQKNFDDHFWLLV